MSAHMSPSQRKDEEGAELAADAADADGVRHPTDHPKTTHSHPFQWLVVTVAALTWGVPPATDPRSYSRSKKMAIVVALSVCSLIGALGQHIYAPSLLQVQTDFQTTTVLVNLTISLFAWMSGFAPILWSVIGDTAGRKRVLFTSWLLFLASTITCWQSSTITMLLVGRAIQGASVSAVWNVGAGSISDLFEIHERGTALGWFQSGAIIGPILGPPLGGVIGETLGWRATFLLLLVLGCVGMVIILFVPETLRSNFVHASPKTLNPNSTLRQKVTAVLISNYNPLSSLRYLRYWFVTSAIIVATGVMIYYWSWLTYAPTAWSTNYGFNETVVGLAYLPFAVGQCAGAQLGGTLSDREIRRSSARNKGVRCAEDRLRVIPYAMVPFSIGVLGLSWSVQYQVHVAVPLICLVFAGVGYMTVSNITTVYLVDIFTSRASSISALVMLVKTGVSASAPLWSITLLSNWGLGWYLTFTVFLSVATCALCLAVVQWGYQSRIQQGEWKAKQQATAALSVVVSEEQNDVKV